MSKPNLAQLLIEATRKADQELADKKYEERIAAIAKPEIDKIVSQYLAEAGDDLTCPSCGYHAAATEFESDAGDDADEFRTDDVTGVSDGNVDDSNQGDAAKVPKWDNRRIDALKAKYANKRLSVIDRILVNRGVDPFDD
jgi:hypothetical protein